MRVPKWIVPAALVATLLSGCMPNGDKKDSALPTATSVVADAGPSTPEPVETRTEEPADEPTQEPTATEPKEADPTPVPAKTRSITPGLPEANLIITELRCIKPRKLPKLAETNGNDYPKIVFNAMCGSEKSKNRAKYRFGQVGVGEGVTCGDEYVIDGNEPTGVAWWCPGKKVLISSPAAVIDNYGSDKWKLMRELTIAYAMAHVQTKGGSTADLKKVACVIGRTILNLRTSGLLSTGNANSLMDNFTSMLENANADALNLKLRLGYNGKHC